ncbi:FeoA family protein [Wolinella succinogenes]|uniref:FeoA family protein n=1 Tax=Wolinella succinogenes TaxID=844 RepID=UPI0023537277|nr:FeoA family protein [Wolinella succinogenes]
MIIMTLTELPHGQEAMISEVRAEGALLAKLLDMGFFPGRKIEVIRQAPLLDPLWVRVASGDVGIRRSEAMLIEVGGGSCGLE